MDEISPFEPTVLGAMWRFRWLVLAILVIFAAISTAYGISRPLSYQAAASLVIEDPLSSSLFDIGATSRPERYVANQAAILQSSTLSDRAAELAVDDVPLLGDPAEIRSGLDVLWSTSNDNIDLLFTTSSPNTAVPAVNAVIAAYGDLRQESTAKGFIDALAQLDDSISEVDAQLAGLQNQIRDELAPSEARRQLDDQFEAAIASIVDVQAQLARASAAERPELRVELDDLFQQLQILQLVTLLDGRRPEFSALLEEQSQTISRKANLLERRDGLVVESRLESTGIVLASPALEEFVTGGEAVRTVIVGLILGTLVAAGVAYLLALRRRTFTDRGQPEVVLKAPLIAEVPDFAEESLKNELPVYSYPSSISAEAFRFVASAVDLAAGAALRRVEHTGPADPAGPTTTRKVLGVVSGSQGDGKTVVVANTALAAARLGERVLVIDGDFGDQRLTEVIVGASVAGIGITEVVDQGVSLRRAVQRVDLPGGATVDLLSRGQVPVMAADFFRAKAVRDLFDAVGEEYDLVLVDMPPLLQVAYASTILSYCDRPVVVVPHGGNVATLEELADRLGFLQSDPVGYVYNRAPLREGRSHPQGSMKDVLGRADVERS